jgi:hypothetical protein
LRQAEEGTAVGEVCRKAGISEATFYNWRKKYAEIACAWKSRSTPSMTCCISFKAPTFSGVSRMRKSRSVITDSPDQHGFVMCGLATIFLHHLPMFNVENHRYQCVARIRIPPHLHKKYIADRALHPTTPYILGNLSTDLFTLPDLKIGSRKWFIADIFRGMPKNPNKDIPLFHSIRVNVESIIHFRHFDILMPYMPVLSYLIFGTCAEAHLAHFLTKQPDFDNVLSLQKMPDWLSPLYLEVGAQIDFPDLSWNPPYTRSPLMQARYKVQFQGLSPAREIDIGLNYWFDVDNLNKLTH